MQKIFVNTDGGARGNPGPSGIGVLIKDEAGNDLGSFSKFIGHQTNNFAEYEAVVAALDALKERFGKETKEISVSFRLDSELVVRQLQKRYKVKEPGLKVQFQKVQDRIGESFPHVSFSHVRREENAEADALANEAMDQAA